MTHQIITIKLLGSEHQIKCAPEKEQTLKAAAVELTKKVKSVQKKSNLSLSEATLLTALNLCGEQIEQNQTANAFSEKQSDLLKSLSQKVNAALAL